jgi:hypothetical protein
MPKCALGADGSETRQLSRVRWSACMAIMSPADYRERAEACERLSETVLSPEARETMLFLASRWRALADADDIQQIPTVKRARSQHPSESD